MLQYFTDATSVVKEKLTNNQVLISNENQESQGSNKYSKSYYLITESLETKFGAAKHFIANIRDGEDGSNTKYRNIQDIFVGNYSKLETLDHHCTKYEFMDTLLIP